MPELSFDLNLGAMLSPLFLLVLAWLVNGARHQVDKRVDERHGETTAHLDRIEAQTIVTNGRVTSLETRQTDHEKDAKADHDLLFTLKGNVETLMGRKGETT